MEREIFSYYRPPISQAVVPSGSKTLEEIYQMITTDRTLEENTERLRDTLLNDGEEEYRNRKRLLLPSVTFGGVFDYRHRDPQGYRESLQNKLQTETDPQKASQIEKTISLLEGKKGLLSPSGLVIIDIDHISRSGVSLEELRSRISSDPETGVRLVFVSPSGDGLKLVCKTDSRIETLSQYEDIYNRLRNYINTTYPEIEVDKSGKDVTRLCLLPFDSEAIWRDWEDTFHPERHPLPSTRRNSPREDYRDLLREWEDGDGVEEIVRRVEESGRDIAPEYLDYLPLVYAFTALGERGRSLLHRVCRLSPKYNPEETDRDWENCLNSGETQSIGYFINLCKESGIDVSFPSRSSGKTHSRDHRKGDGVPVSQTPTETPPEEKFKDYLTIQDLRSIASTKREGIKTPYIFKNSQGREENLILPSGALTLVCGKSSHGKSRLLQNLSLQIASEEYNRQGEGVVLYFSFEECLLEVVERYANIQVNIPHLSQYGTTNTDVLRDYFQTGTLNKCPQKDRPDTLKRLSGFTTLYNQGRLRIYYTPDLYSGDLCLLLEYLSSQMKIKAVFLDYVQAIYKEGYRKDRREELREICKEINKTAISLDIPIILSAQLNRETPNPSEMSGDNIAESADITRYANTILLLWDSAKERDIRGGKSAYLNTPEGQRLQSRGFNLGESGKLFAVLSKNRGGTPDIESILEYVPETGRISSNEDLPQGDSPEAIWGGEVD